VIGRVAGSSIEPTPPRIAPPTGLIVKAGHCRTNLEGAADAARARRRGV